MQLYRLSLIQKLSRQFVGTDDTDTDSNTEQINSEGSGVIYKKDGDDAYLVTNTHVISGAKKVDIRLADGTKVPGEIVGSDTYSDIAVVKYLQKRSLQQLSLVTQVNYSVGNRLSQSVVLWVQNMQIQLHKGLYQA